MKLFLLTCILLLSVSGYASENQFVYTYTADTAETLRFEIDLGKRTLAVYNWYFDDEMLEGYEKCLEIVCMGYHQFSKKNTLLNVHLTEEEVSLIEQSLPLALEEMDKVQLSDYFEKGFSWHKIYLGNKSDAVYFQGQTTEYLYKMLATIENAVLKSPSYNNEFVKYPRHSLNFWIDVNGNH